jgi:hypothetical protein
VPIRPGSPRQGHAATDEPARATPPSADGGDPSDASGGGSARPKTSQNEPKRSASAAAGPLSRVDVKPTALVPPTKR